MCNKYVPPKHVKVKVHDEIYEAEFRLEDVRPTDPAPIISVEGLVEMRWGWQVPWDRKPFTNAKSEKLTESDIYKNHLNQRCLILAEAFYEKGVKFIRPDKAMFAMAGLFRKESDGQRFTMLTTTPNESVALHHDRMPFLLRSEQFESWLGEEWQTVLANPDKGQLEKVILQPELF